MVVVAKVEDLQLILDMGQVKDTDLIRVTVLDPVPVMEMDMEVREEVEVWAQELGLVPGMGQKVEVGTEAAAVVGKKEVAAEAVIRDTDQGVEEEKEVAAEAVVRDTDQAVVRDTDQGVEEEVAAKAVIRDTDQAVVRDTDQGVEEEVAAEAVVRDQDQEVEEEAAAAE